MNRKQAKEILDQCRVLATERKWQELLDLSADPAAQQRMPKLVPLRIAAARHTGASEVLAQAEAICAVWSEDDTGPVIIATLNAFISIGEYSRVWSVIRKRIGDGEAFSFDDRMSLRYRSLLRLLLREMDDGAEKLEIRALFAKLKERKNPVPSRESPLTFAEAAGLHVNALANITSAQGARASHAEKIATYLDQFLKAAELQPQAEILEVDNVFVDTEGRFWNEAGQRGGKFGGDLPAISRERVAQIDAGLHLIHPTDGIYHWLVDRLPKTAWLISGQHRDIPVLIDKDAPSFEKAALELAGFGPEQIVEVENVVFCRRLYVVIHSMMALRYWNQYRPLFDEIGNRVQLKALDEGFIGYDRVYISRRDAARRPMLNEAELETELMRRGFACVTFSDIPLWKQMAILASARIVVAPHGAGLSHIIGLPAGANIVEILPIREGTYFLRLNYARLASIRGHNYAMWVEEQDAGVDCWELSTADFLRFLDARLDQTNA